MIVGSLGSACALIFDQLIRQLVDKFIKGFLLFIVRKGAANVGKVGIDDNHAKDGSVDSLRPILGSNLLLKVKIILSFAIVLVDLVFVYLVVCHVVHELILAFIPHHVMQVDFDVFS